MIRETALATWQDRWRNAVAPCLLTAELEAMRQGLTDREPCIGTNLIVEPYPIPSHAPLTPERVCPVAYGLWRGSELGTVHEVEEAFATLCGHADTLAGRVGAVGDFFDWVDGWPWAVVREDLLAEVERELARREEEAPCPSP